MNFLLLAVLILLGSILFGLGVSAFFKKVEHNHMELTDEYDELFTR